MKLSIPSGFTLLFITGTITMVSVLIIIRSHLHDSRPANGEADLRYPIDSVTPKRGTTQPTLYRNTRYGFSIFYPEDFHLKEYQSAQADSFSLAFYSSANSDTAAMAISVFNIPPNASAESYIRTLQGSSQVDKEVSAGYDIFWHAEGLSRATAYIPVGQHIFELYNFLASDTVFRSFVRSFRPE